MRIGQHLNCSFRPFRTISLRSYVGTIARHAWLHSGSAVESYCLQKEDLYNQFKDDMPEVLNGLREWALQAEIE